MFLWKIIWFLFDSIAEGLPLITKNNIDDMSSTATFAGACSFYKVYHCIFAHLGLYSVDNGTNLLLEFLNWLRSISIKLILHVTPKKKSARFVSTFSSRAARFARKFESALGAQFDRRASRSILSGPRASRSVFYSSHTFKFISYNLILKLKPIL